MKKGPSTAQTTCPEDADIEFQIVPRQFLLGIRQQRSEELERRFGGVSIVHGQGNVVALVLVPGKCQAQQLTRMRVER